MKQATLVLLCCIISVISDTPNWTPIGSPLITAYPCGQTRDIVTWFDPSLPPREKNRYYAYIHTVLPENSSLRLVFDSEVIITINFRTEDKKYTRIQFNTGQNFLFRFFKEIKGMGFIVKGAMPGIIPYFTSISLNYQELCRRPYIGYLEHYVAETLTSGSQENCGIRKVKHRKKSLSNGVTKPGEWPWHAALYRLDQSVSKYICGGTLISKSFVLTAAHCASLRGVPLLPEALKVVLGKFHLKHSNNRSQEIEVQRIILHEGFDYRYLYADIALLKLKSEAIFAKFVQPICLWYSKAVDRLPRELITGTVVGWGLNRTAALTNRLKLMKMPMVSETTCVLSNPSLYANIIVDDTKFCAGIINGTSACNGDSGSAFQVFVPDEDQDSNEIVSGAWYIRGIVSLTASKFDSSDCDPSQYVVFTDVEDFRVWIDAYIDNEDY